jgi:hypothetical protein
LLRDRIGWSIRHRKRAFSERPNSRRVERQFVRLPEQLPLSPRADPPSFDSAPEGCLSCESILSRESSLESLVVTPLSAACRMCLSYRTRVLLLLSPRTTNETQSYRALTHVVRGGEQYRPVRRQPCEVEGENLRASAGDPSSRCLCLCLSYRDEARTSTYIACCALVTDLCYPRAGSSGKAKHAEERSWSKTKDGLSA